MSTINNDIEVKLPKGWKIKNLSEVVSVNSGISLPSIFKEGYNDGDLEYFKVAQMNNHEKFMVNSEIYFNEKIASKHKIKIFPKGSVLIPKRGGAIFTNKKRVLLKDASYDSNIMGLKADISILSDDYLYVFMNSVDLSNFLDESTIPQINNKHIDRIQIPLPPLPEQQLIVQQLDTLFERIDKAIALTQDNLVQSAQLLPAAINEVFGKAEEKGWMIVSVSSVVKINSGVSLPAIFKDTNYNDGDIEFFKVAQMSNHEKHMINSELSFNKETGKKNKITIFPKGSILIPKRGGAIYTNKKRILLNDASYDSNIMGLKADNSILSDDYLYSCLSAIDLKDYLDESTIPQINNKHIERMQIPIPDLTTQQNIVTYLNQLSVQQQQLQQHYTQQLQQLQALKASLLDSAFRGEL